jgi:hypothetical protein
MSNLPTKLLAAALLAAASSPALAAAGNGIRLGGSEGRLHPFIELEGRYDSNVYLAVDGATVADFIIHTRPGLKLEVPGEMTEVTASASLDWAKYTGAKAPDGFDTSKLDKLYASADLGISVNKKGTTGFELIDTFRRSDQPQALSFGTAVFTNYNRLDLQVPIRPGGGAMTIALNGLWSVESYEQPVTEACLGTSPPPACDVSGLGYNDLGGGAGLAWKFLPRTSALLDVSYTKRLPNDVTRSRTGEPSILRIPAGLTGLITPHFGATVKVGYGTTGGDTGSYDSLGTVLATLEGEWMPAETTSVKLGYLRDLAVDPVAIYTTDTVALTARQLVAGRVALGLTGSWQQLGYSMPGSETASIVMVKPSVGVDITRWLKAEVAYAYTTRTYSAGAPSVGADYTKNEAWLKAVATY